MKKLCRMILLFVIFLSACSPGRNAGHSLLISPNNSYLVYPDGTPFLWIGDTAWELFHRLDREEASNYLQNRLDKGISIIQAIILAEQDGLRVPNAYGDLPLIDQDPTQPNEAYFEHVDFIVDKANDLGLFVALGPTWGDKLFSVNPGAGPVIFNKENAEVYGQFLGKRYKDNNIVWLLGGDRNVDNIEVLEIWRAMARGIKKGDEGRNLITYHPRGGSSSAHWLHNEDWLDFNMFQSGHSKHYTEVYQYTEEAALLHPRKPVVDGEPPYEDIGVKFWDYWEGITKAEDDNDTSSVIDINGLIQDRSHYAEGFFTDADIRVHGYWNFLSGACGYTYGNNAIWQMWEYGDPFAVACLTDWREAMDRPGAGDLIHMRKLLEARPYYKLIPDQSIIFGPKGNGREHLRAAIADDHSFILVYLSVGQRVKVNMSKMEDRTVASWYDTREGITSRIGEFENSGIIDFTPPSSGIGNDWILILDDITAKNSSL